MSHGVRGLLISGDPEEKGSTWDTGISLRWEMRYWAETQHRDGASSTPSLCSLLQKGLENFGNPWKLGNRASQRPEHSQDWSSPESHAVSRPLLTAQAAPRTRGENHAEGCTKYVGCKHTCTHVFMAKHSGRPLSFPFTTKVPKRCPSAAVMWLEGGVVGAYQCLV